MHDTTLVIGIIGICILIFTAFVLVYAYIMLRRYPKGYPKVMIVEFFKLANNFWSLSAAMQRIYLVSIHHKPKLKVVNWETGLLHMPDHTFKSGDFIIYPVRNGLPAVLWISSITHTGYIQTIFIGVFNGKMASDSYYI